MIIKDENKFITIYKLYKNMILIIYMNEINKYMNSINKHMNSINKYMNSINKYMYSFNPNYYDINILGCNNINNLLITEKNIIESHLSRLECININVLHYIKFLNNKYYINNNHNNTINFIIQNKLQLKHLLDKLQFIYNENLYNINLIKKKINIINLTSSMFIPFNNI